ncbi:imelysin family protein [Luteolibacter sp. LG18]|uniref:imelysin family protein n=1 Tax=Luteolibacter sp. LG18 TaxID=2819286 RepID=UPI002B323E7F|nr:peptidase [Luteolibacter sp. LG18]
MHPFRFILPLLCLFPVSVQALDEGQPAATKSARLKTEVVRHYAALAGATCRDALQAAEALQSAIDAFLDAPSDATLSKARAAWLDARKPYLHSEAFRFYEGPIDQLEGRINGWPVDENYIDYVEGDAHAGIINHPELYPELSKETIADLNEKDGEKSISTGYHAIEFLLWGQDLDPKGPGKRSFQDYLTGPGATAPHPERRREYLRLITGMLVEDLKTVENQWADHRPDNYRAWFEASATHQSLRKILHGIAALGGTELAGERLTVAYETKEQEDEHSCFSDNTCTDVVEDALGIRNAYTGDYTCLDGTRLQGPGIADLLKETDPALADELGKQIDASVENARSIPSPFDQAFLGADTAPGRIAIHRTIRSLQSQTETMAKVASLLGVRDETQ